jgi:hypothetical protein
MGVMAELIISNLPIYERKIEQADNILSILSIIGSRSSNLGFIVPIGSPRYVKGIDPIWHPKTAASCCILSSDTLIGKIMDFWKLTWRPVEEANCCNISF